MLNQTIQVLSHTKVQQEVNHLGELLGIFFCLKAFGLLPSTFEMKALFFEVTVSVLVGLFFLLKLSLNNCMVNKPISEIPVYVTRLASHSSCGVGRSRYGIQFHRQAFSCLSHANALLIPVMLSWCHCLTQQPLELMGAALFPRYPTVTGLS